MKKLFVRTCFLTALFAVAMVFPGTVPKPAWGFFQPGYENKGITGFLDACASPGSYYQNYFLFFKSVDLRIGSHKAPGEFKLSQTALLNQYAYVSKKKVLGGFLGGEIIVPTLNVHLTSNGSRSKDHGLGDIFLGSFIQGDKKTLCLGKFQMPFFWRALGGVFVPSGAYDHHQQVNVGCNLYTLHTYFSSTLFLTPAWEVSSRFMYSWHTKNNDYGLARDNLKPGQLFNVHFSTSYALREWVRPGIIGDYWRQTTDDRLNGNDLRGRELAFSLGPGVVFEHAVGKTKLVLICHSLFDLKVRNRPEGDLHVARLVVPF
jgi:hypothetical protein